MGSLAKTLIDRFKISTGADNGHILLAAGTTRLGKIEFVPQPNWAIKDTRTFRYIEEGLLIRIRQNRYSSAGIIESRINDDESKVRIHIEHQSSYAQTIQIPFRSKRPRFVTLGEPNRRDTYPRWFCEPHNHGLPAVRNA